MGSCEMTEIEKREKFVGDVMSEYMNALEKHPLWPDRLTDMTLYEIEESLSSVRKWNDGGGATVATIILEELSEAFEALVKGDLAQARAELAQTGAMIMRLYINAERYLGKGGSDR